MDSVPGKIVTFYSFKGGVGRTMAMANVAFIAAMNGMRVLVMDWDLEAPGLAYYFRALLDPQQAKAAKEARGILNIFSEWVETVENASPDEITSALDGLVAVSYTHLDVYKRQLRRKLSHRRDPARN